LYVHSVNDFRHTEMYIVKPLVPHSSSFVVEIAIEKPKSYKITRY